MSHDRLSVIGFVQLFFLGEESSAVSRPQITDQHGPKAVYF